MKKDDEKPPGSENNMDTGAGHIPAHDSLAGRFKSIGELWRGCWSVPPVRNSLHGRCHFISKNIVKILLKDPFDVKDFEEFIIEREKLIKERVKKLFS